MKTFTAHHNNALAADSGSANQGRTSRVPPRSDIPESRKWNLSPLYQSDAGWEEDFLRIDPLVAPLEKMRGCLSAAPAVASFMDAETALDRLLERLWVFAHLRADEDTADQKAQARQARITAKLADVASRLSWAAPELLSNSEETLLGWMDSPELARNRYALLRLARRRKHVLTEGEERILARCGEVLSAPHQAFNLLTNADMRFPEVTGPAGEKTELSQGRYILFQRNPDRRVREDSFRKMYETFGALRNTLASLLTAAVKSHNAQAELRRFPSAIEAALHEDQVPVSLYDGLIASTRAALPVFHRYTLLRRRALKLDKLDMYDLYAPLVPEYASDIPFERAREWVLEACAALGAEYCAALDSAFSSHWIDVLENRGKRSGAYSSGCYDSPPYILLNYQGKLDDVFTLAHELGHSMHTLLANRTQPHRFARYPIFIAEIASTLNEELLLRHLLASNPPPALRAALLNHMCDSFKGTVYRQVMFAEFEKLLHDSDARGEPLTAETISDRYAELNRAYQGPEVEPDPLIAMEWARIPHFYYNFYVYKYATSHCAALALVERVISSRPEADRYLDLLRAGGSGDPLELISKTGVDPSAPGTYTAAFQAFGRAVDELSKAVEG